MEITDLVVDTSYDPVRRSSLDLDGVVQDHGLSIVVEPEPDHPADRIRVFGDMERMRAFLYGARIVREEPLNREPTTSELLAVICALHERVRELERAARQREEHEREMGERS